MQPSATRRLYRQICESRRNYNSVASLTNPNPTSAVRCRAVRPDRAGRGWQGADVISLRSQSEHHHATSPAGVSQPSRRRRRRLLRGCRRRRRRHKSIGTALQLSCLRRHRVTICSSSKVDAPANVDTLRRRIHYMMQAQPRMQFHRPITQTRRRGEQLTAASQTTIAPLCT